MGPLPRFFQVGIVQEAAHERLTAGARLARKDRRGTLVEALLADERLRQYAKRNYREAGAKAVAGGRLSYRQRKAAAAPAGERQHAYRKARADSSKKKG